LIPGPGQEVPADADAGVLEKENVTIVFLVCEGCDGADGQCEQVSHHPPVSAAYYVCPEKGIEMYGMDQIAAKVSGMCTLS
jgi:hypothetical protein